MFSEKAVFSEETAKNCFEGAFDQLLGKGGFSRRQSRLMKTEHPHVPFVVFGFADKNSLTKTLLPPPQVLKLYSHHFYC